MYYLINYESEKPLTECPFIITPYSDLEEAILHFESFGHRNTPNSLTQPLIKNELSKARNGEKFYARYGNTGWYVSIEGPRDPSSIIGVPVEESHAEELYVFRGIRREDIRF